MPDDQQQDPLKALEDLIAQRKAGDAAPLVAAPVEPPAPPLIDTDALQAKAEVRDAASIEKQRAEIAALKDSPQQQVVATQQAVANADKVTQGEFSDDFAIRQVDHTTIPAEDLG